MRVDDFDFDLPDKRIALSPAEPRDSARMLHVAGDDLFDRTIRDLPNILQPGDRLVVNDTKVIPAQLRGTRPARSAQSGPVTIDVTLHKRLAETDGARWRAFVRPAKRLSAGDELTFSDHLSARIESRDGAEAILCFNCAGAAFDQALSENGAPPLPPYIARRRTVTDHDTERYQTVYANAPGSVAAPTAGLHFTDNLLAALNARAIDVSRITLHVGAGTFLPVAVDDTRDHVMHSEWGEISASDAQAINKTRDAGGRIIAVGTTSLRLLESAVDASGTVHPFGDETDIFITPGVPIRSADLLLTNFHLPRSTLFMLACAFAGTAQMKAAYAHAIQSDYRFYSYGDACLLERG